MGVPGSAVQQDQFRVRVLPYQRTQPPAGGDFGEDPRHRRRAVRGQAVLRGVLVEQPELVVVDVVGHRFTSHWDHWAASSSGDDPQDDFP